MVDGGRHEDDFQHWMCVEQLLQFEKQEVAINRAFMNLAKNDSFTSCVDACRSTHLIHDNVCYILQTVPDTKPTKDNTSCTEQQLGLFTLFTFTADLGKVVSAEAVDVHLRTAHRVADRTIVDALGRDTSSNGYRGYSTRLGDQYIHLRSAPRQNQGIKNKLWH